MEATADILQYSTSIKDNENVKALWAILQKNLSPSKDEFATIINQITTMENQLNTMVDELSSMRKVLAKAQDTNHPAESMMKKAVNRQHNFIEDLQDKVSELKESIVDGCKNAIDSFKSNGILALNNIIDFIKIKPILESMQNSLDGTITKDNKAIEKIETVSTEYHEAGRHLKNIGRAILGKEPIQEAKPMGKIAQAFCKPYRVQCSCCEGIKNNVKVAINQLEKLEEQAAKHKPSIIATMEKHEKQILQDKKDNPVSDIAKTTKDNKDER